ncbi:MAG: hypothetical protein ACO1OF_23200 [Adhaeribacter sp.]
MQHLRTFSVAFFLLTFSWTIALGQTLNENLIIGKWKFVKATTGETKVDFKYNGDPLLTFERGGHWITEDTNPKYRQSGSWKIENNILIRDPEVSGLGDIGPYTRVIDKLTETDLVFYAPDNGARTFTFYFTRIE